MLYIKKIWKISRDFRLQINQSKFDKNHCLEYNYYVYITIQQIDKKTYVLKALELLKDTWNLAEWLIYLVNQNEVDEKVLDILIHILQDAIGKATDEISKEKLQKANDFFLKLKQSEEQQKQIDQADKNLEQLLSTF